MTRKRKRNVTRNDSGFSDAFIRRGVAQYLANNSFQEGKLVNYQLLNKLWSNRLAQRISSLPAEAALKNGYVIEGDEDENNILQYLDTLYANKKLIEAMTWARHYGRSCIFMLLDDGRSEEEPVDYNNLKAIRGLEVYDKQCIVEDFTGYMINDDPTDPQFGKPEWYQISPPQSGNVLFVHHSRLLMFDGDLLPNYERIARGGGGMSCLEGVVKAIWRCDTSHSTAFNILERMSTSLLKFNNLANLLATNGGTDKVQKRLELIDMARNVMNSIAIGTDDEYQVFNIPMAGVPEVLDRFGLYLCSLTGIPFTVLFGRSPAGLNSTGNGDLENYYNDVRGKSQERMLKPQLEKLVKLAQHCKECGTGGNELKDWTIKFNPLWMLSEKEVAETKRIEAEGEKIVVEAIGGLMDRQLMDNSEVREYLKNKLSLPIAESVLDMGDDEDGEEEIEV